MRRVAVNAVFGLVVAVVVYALWPAKPPPAVAPDNLWRVRAEYTYKGAPLVLEFGLACSSIWANPNTHRYSMDVTAGPSMYGVETSDGKAVVISTNSYCDGIRPEEPNGAMPGRFLPATIVYDNPDTLEFGILYGSDEAYENPLSVLGLPKVTFEFIDRATFVRLQRDGVPNVVRTAHVKRGLFARTKKEDAFPGRRPEIGHRCFAWRRYAIPESVRDDVRALWPADRPRYWGVAGASVAKSEGNLAALALLEKLQAAFHAAPRLEGSRISWHRMTVDAFFDRSAGMSRRGAAGRLLFGGEVRRPLLSGIRSAGLRTTSGMR